VPPRLVVDAALVSLACAGALAACGGEPEAARASPSTVVEANAIVERIVDGDTIDVEIDGRHERVRLIGVDTPETKRPDTPVECFGPEATAFTTSLLAEGTPLRLERDVVGRDDYGRLLAYVHRATDGLFVNAELVRAGYARTLTIPPNVAYADAFVDAARAAEASDAGLWSACAG
jgi:endonuclease YncB( thermonuclease family)